MEVLIYKNKGVTAKMAYKWTDEKTIQAYLESAGNLQIGANNEITPQTAELFENDSVFEISTVLSAAWTGIETLDTTTTSDDLKRMAAKLTASRLGLHRVSGGLGESPKWIESYRSEVLAQAMRMVINFETVEIPGATRREDATVAKLLVKVKQREFVPQPPA